MARHSLQKLQRTPETTDHCAGSRSNCQSSLLDTPLAHGNIVPPGAGCLIRGQKFSEASSMLLKFAVSCEAQHMTSSQCKAYLGAVVVLLYAGNAAEAQATYQVSCHRCHRRGAGLTPGTHPPCRLQTSFLSVQLS